VNAGGRVLGRAERLDWLRLIRTENVGPITFRHLLNRFGSAAAALAALPELSRRGGRLGGLAIASKAQAEAELEALERVEARLVALGEPDYPVGLATIEDAPPLLSVRGNAVLLTGRIIAIVGARNASANGVRLARQLALDLGAAGLIVASGLARGIDTGAHQGALAAGTIAVMAGGVDVVYPQENTALYEQVVAQGAAISELPPGVSPQARHFPRRNRLISGLALGVVVVEASPRSGSLITARYALEQGREVFAVPGSPLDPRARGTNHLIRQGATLTEGAADIVPVINAQLARRPFAEPAGLPLSPPEPTPPSEPEIARARDQVAEKLGPTPTPVDEIIRQCQLSPAAVQTCLLELELAGRLVRHPGNQVALIPREEPAEQP
jgi:DNA processing protein